MVFSALNDTPGNERIQENPYVPVPFLHAFQLGRSCDVPWLFSAPSSVVVGVLRGNTIRGNTTRNSERKMALWEGLWEGLWNPLKTSEDPLKTSQNLWKPLKPSLSETLSEADFFPSQNLSGLLPLIVLRLNLSPRLDVLLSSNNMYFKFAQLQGIVRAYFIADATLIQSLVQSVVLRTCRPGKKWVSGLWPKIGKK